MLEVSIRLSSGIFAMGRCQRPDRFTHGGHGTRAARDDPAGRGNDEEEPWSTVQAIGMAPSEKLTLCPRAEMLWPQPFDFNGNMALAQGLL